MSKRFPIPEFYRDQFKNLPWNEPSPISHGEANKLTAVPNGGGAGSTHPVIVPTDFAAKFDFEMNGKPGVMCILPDKDIQLTGHSWAWPIQRALIVDSLDPQSANVLADWHTPRPMNTRLGPDGGISIRKRVVYVLCGHQYGQRWIANRTLLRAADATDGFSVLSATDDSINDFHACNLTFAWS